MLAILYEDELRRHNRINQPVLEELEMSTLSLHIPYPNDTNVSSEDNIY